MMFRSNRFLISPSLIVFSCTAVVVFTSSCDSDPKSVSTRNVEINQNADSDTEDSLETSDSDESEATIESDETSDDTSEESSDLPDTDFPPDLDSDACAVDGNRFVIEGYLNLQARDVLPESFGFIHGIDTNGDSFQLGLAEDHVGGEFDQLSSYDVSEYNMVLQYEHVENCPGIDPEQNYCNQIKMMNGVVQVLETAPIFRVAFYFSDMSETTPDTDDTALTGHWIKGCWAVPSEAAR